VVWTPSGASWIASVNLQRSAFEEGENQQVTEVFRQAAESRIVVNAHRIKAGLCTGEEKP
jgi:hypothetical protein